METPQRWHDVQPAPAPHVGQRPIQPWYVEPHAPHEKRPTVVFLCPLAQRIEPPSAAPTPRARRERLRTHRRRTTIPYTAKMGATITARAMRVLVHLRFSTSGYSTEPQSVRAIALGDGRRGTGCQSYMSGAWSAITAPWPSS